jgi:hypothetical protein
LQKSTCQINGAPNSNIWCGLDVLGFNGTGGTGQHVAREGQAVRYTYASGGATNNPSLWGLLGQYVDETDQLASATNFELGAEFDSVASNFDDSRSRYGVSIATQTVNGATHAFNETHWGLTISTEEYAFDTFLLQIGGNYETAGIDLRTLSMNGVAIGGAAPVVSTTLSTPGPTVAVSDVVPFTKDSVGKDINGTHSGNTTVLINGDAYTITGYAWTSGLAGTLTLSSNCTVADCTAGNAVSASYLTANALWMPTNQTLAWDTNAYFTSKSDGATYWAVDYQGTPIFQVTTTGIKSVLPTSAGTGGLYVCVDSTNTQYKKASCP